MEFINKFFNLFKKKKFVQLFTAILACAIIAIYGTTTILSSYIPWKDYFDKAMAQREHEKYLQSLPFEFLGITVEMADGVTYYQDNRAFPSNEDFKVTAHFTEKGKDSDVILGAEEFTINYAADFNLTGGDITVSYSYQPDGTTEEGEPLDPIVRTATITQNLVPVVLSKLVVAENPYRVHYSDEMTFNAEGIKLNATYNNGDVIEIGEDDVTIKNTGILTTDITSVEVSYSLGGVEISCGVPVTVSSASSFNEGAITKLAVENDIVLEQGAATNSAQAVVRATYNTGNRLIVDDSEYTITGNLPTAYFENNCILTVTANSNSNVFCKTAASVVSTFESETASTTTVVGGTQKTVTDQTTNTSVQATENFASGNSISFKINGNQVSKGKLNLRLANISTSEINLGKVLKLTVNGQYVPVNATLRVAASADTTKYNFATYTIATPLMQVGDNQVVITFNTAAKLAFDSAEYQTKYEGVFYSSMDEYVTQCIANGVTPDFDVEMSCDWFDAYTAGGNYTHGMCSDGTYYYVARTSYSNELRGIIVTKHDVATGEILATSVKSQAICYEAGAACAYNDGKIIIFGNDGTNYCINSDLSGSWSEYDGFDFRIEDSANEGETKKLVLNDVYYNSALQKYAVYSGSTVYIFNSDMECETSFIPDRDARMRVSGSTDYIYVSTSHDGLYQPKIQMFDWSGNKVATASIPNNQEIMNTGLISGSVNLKATNCQGIVTMNDSWYISVLAFTQSGLFSDRGAIIKVDYPQLSDKLSIVYSAGDYYQTAQKNGNTPQATLGKNVNITDTTGWSMGGVSDGKFVYFASNAGSNSNTTVYKYNPLSGEVVANSKLITHGSSGDNSKMFIKDGKLCYIINSGKVYSCELANFSKNCDFTLDTSFDDVLRNCGVLPFAATWNDVAGRFATIGGNKLNIMKENGEIVTNSIALSSGAKDVASDDKFIYVVRSANNWDNNPVEVYTWDGTHVGTLNVNNCKASFDAGTGGFNVQGIFTHNDRLYIAVCVFNSTGSAKGGINMVEVVMDETAL